MAKGKYEKWLEEENLILLEGWAREGLTDEQIAKNIGISRSTLNEWKKKYSDISDTLKKGKAVIDYLVENALLKKAIGGYRTKEIIREIVINPVTGEEGLKITKIIEREVTADTTALIFWLKNRRPDIWTDKPKPVTIEELEDDGLLAALKSPIDDAELEDDINLIDD